MYAAITRYGATPLYPATGTTGGLALVYQGASGAGGVQGVRSRGVTAAEYRSLLDDGHGGGMLYACNALFQAHGITAWRWQQDGAKAHYSRPNTANGRMTRATITAVANLVEPWPPSSPDLSPIEKAWSAVELHVHAHESSHDSVSFLAALRRS